MSERFVLKVLEMVLATTMLWKATMKSESGHVDWSGEGAKTSGLRDWET
jgi:hypothetical protein